MTRPSNGFVVVIAAITLLMCSGCATLVTGGGPEAKVRVSSKPAGAKVVIDGKDYGTTPVVVSLSRRDAHHVVLKMAGYKDVERDLNPGPNPWIFGNMVVGGLIGVAV